MQNHDQKEREAEAQVLDTQTMKMIIPECCREGWDSCPHVIRKPKATRRNVGL